MFSQTIRENLLYANPKVTSATPKSRAAHLIVLQATSDQLQQALEDAGCTGIIDSLPDGLDTKLAGAAP